MEPSNADYFYTLALRSITFVGFTAIVMILREGLGRCRATTHRSRVTPRLNNYESPRPVRESEHRDS